MVATITGHQYLQNNCWLDFHCHCKETPGRSLQAHAPRPPGNGRRFIDGDVSLGDKLPNLQLEIYALVKKGNYRKYIDRILYTSLVKITPNVCLKSWKVKNLAKNFTKSM